MLDVVRECAGMVHAPCTYECIDNLASRRNLKIVNSAQRKSEKRIDSKLENLEIMDKN